jgi:hypothetical protein
MINKLALLGFVLFLVFGFIGAYDYYVHSRGVVFWLILSAAFFGIWLLNGIKDN